MEALEFTVLRWAAWAPGLVTAQDWRSWAECETALQDDGSSPGLPQVKPMLRRRFSRLTRMALHTCFEVLPQECTVRTLFCSRHGEIHRTRGLLEDIVNSEPISPMGFSLSVHNTASGLYSIASGNTAPSSAIAAGADTLEMAVVDALGHMQHAPAEPVLVVFADEPLPQDYRGYIDEHCAPHALALLLSCAGEGERLSLTRLSRTVDGEESHGLALAKWLSSDAAHCRVRGERCGWEWARRRG